MQNISRRAFNDNAMRSAKATYVDMCKAEQTLTPTQNAVKNSMVELKALDQMQDDECYKAIKEILQRYYGTSWRR